MLKSGRRPARCRWWRSRPAMRADAEAAARAGCDGFIAKPFPRAHSCGEVAAVLGPRATGGRDGRCRRAVLVVDDDEHIRGFLATCCRPTATTSSRRRRGRAIELLRAAEFDAVSRT